MLTVNLRRFVTSNNDHWQRLTLVWSPVLVPPSMNYWAGKSSFHSLFGDKCCFFTFVYVFRFQFKILSQTLRLRLGICTGEFEGFSPVLVNFLFLLSCLCRSSPLCIFLFCCRDDFLLRALFLFAAQIDTSISWFRRKHNARSPERSMILSVDGTTSEFFYNLPIFFLPYLLVVPFIQIFLSFPIYYLLFIIYYLLFIIYYL